jgi:hypothetical protein
MVSYKSVRTLITPNLLFLNQVKDLMGVKLIFW